MADWWLTKDGDKSCLELYERHYPAYEYKDGRERFQFVGPGFNIVLRTARADAFFVWRKYIDDTIPKQEGVECAAFRNEGAITSSKLIRQACAVADCAWPGERHYTKVNPEEVGRGNSRHVPGYCFLRAGWRRCGKTKGGLLIMERTASMAFEQAMKRIPDHLYWMMAKGRTRPTEPLFAVQLIDAESHVAIAEAEAETLHGAIDAAIDLLPPAARRS